MHATRQSTLSESQLASAAAHLSRFDLWRYYRVDGVRYVALPSARSGRVYHVRADGDGCDCKAYQERGYAICSHMQAVRSSNTNAFARQQEMDARRPKVRYSDIFPACPCGDVAESRDGLCDRCASNREHEQRMAARRELVGAGR